MNRRNVSVKAAIVLALSIPLTSCTRRIIAPTEQDLSSANYGTAPASSELPDLLRKYLKATGYFDPNGTEIENCSQPIKGWVRNDNYDVDADFLFGWKSNCDVNGKNRLGGHVGFETIEYFLKDGKVLSGRQPRTGDPHNSLFTPGSKFSVWGKAE